MTASIIWGISGTLWMAGSVFMYKADNKTLTAIYIAVGAMNIAVALNV